MDYSAGAERVERTDLLPCWHRGDSAAATWVLCWAERSCRGHRAAPRTTCSSWRKKSFSKAEDRYVNLDAAQPSPRALELATITRKDPTADQLIGRIDRSTTRKTRCAHRASSLAT